MTKYIDMIKVCYTTGGSLVSISNPNPFLLLGGKRGVFNRMSNKKNDVMFIKFAQRIPLHNMCKNLVMKKHMTGLTRPRIHNYMRRA
jgi:hypothetical protein